MVCGYQTRILGAVYHLFQRMLWVIGVLSLDDNAGDTEIMRLR